MGREWKPGDVALVTWTSSYDGEVQTQVRLLVERGMTDMPASERKQAWWGRDGYLEAASKDIEARPLVVIDPEDREQVGQLAGLLGENGWRATQAHGLRDALRSLITPPKPKEPTGLGAVVQEAPGAKWVRVARGEYGWVRTDAMLSVREGRRFADIAAVRVLSEGVS